MIILPLLFNVTPASVCQSSYPSVWLSAVYCLSACQSVNLQIHLSVCLISVCVCLLDSQSIYCLSAVCLSARISECCLSSCLSAYLFLYAFLSSFLFDCLSVYLYVCLFVWMPFCLFRFSISVCLCVLFLLFLSVSSLLVCRFIFDSLRASVFLTTVYICTVLILNARLLYVLNCKRIRYSTCWAK
jgi:hypothetical protein